MAKRVKNVDVNLFYSDKGQDEEELDKKKRKEREKRIKQNKKEKRKSDFDIDNEKLIQMTNKNKVKKEEEQKKKLSKKEIKKMKKIKKIKLVLKIVLFLALITGAIIFAMVSPIFNIKDIQVENNEKVPTNTITSLAEIKEDDNIFRFNANEVIKKIKQNAYIDEVKIHRSIPSTIKIEIKEREHAYSIEFLGQYVYINTQGYILDISGDSGQKKIIKGMKTPEEQVEIGNRLNDEDLNRIEDVIKIMDATKEYNLEDKVTSIDISDKNEYNVYLEGERKTVHLGNNTNLSNKMLYVNAIIEKEKDKAGDIFANGDLNNKFKVYFRESLNP